jgi:hypothetical protein
MPPRRPRRLQGEPVRSAAAPSAQGSDAKTALAPELERMLACPHPADVIAWADRQDRPLIGRERRKCFRCGMHFPIGKANDDGDAAWEVLAVEIVAAEHFSDQELLQARVSPGESAAFWAGFYDSTSTKAQIYPVAYAAGALARRLKWPAAEDESR